MHYNTYNVSETTSDALTGATIKASANTRNVTGSIYQEVLQHTRLIKW